MHDVPLVLQAGLCEHPLRAMIRGERNRHQRSQVQRVQPYANALASDLGGQSPSPELGQEAITDLDFVHAVDLQMTEHRTPRHRAGLVIAQHPDAEPVLLPVGQIPGQII